MIENLPMSATTPRLRLVCSIILVSDEKGLSASISFDFELVGPNYVSNKIREPK